jgi:DNA-binding HxlR family transcriptional regulator
VAGPTSRFVFRTRSFDWGLEADVEARPVVDFRYAQFCPLTRAVEILGERWTLLILRELVFGPKRFSDLKSALNGVSPSVLADRLARLEERSIVSKRVVPPSAIAIYELDEAGRALAPLLADLTRWGLRFLGAPEPEDRMRPEWLLLGFRTFARSHATETIGARLRVADDDESVDIYVRGSEVGTVVSSEPLAHDVTLAARPMEMMLFANGMLDPLANGALSCEGDVEIARRIPALFDFRPAEAAEVPFGSTRPITPANASDSPRPARARRGASRPAAARDRHKTASIPGGDPS